MIGSTREHHPRLLSILIIDKNLLSQEAIDKLATDISSHDYDQRVQLADWLLANQLMEDKKTKSFIETWEIIPHLFCKEFK
jgi:flagellar motor switch protein FliM